jgi:hypothetical protein
MSKIEVGTRRLPLLLHELRLPAIARLWPEFAERADKESWPAARFLSALAELEMAERGQRRIARKLADAHLPPGKTLDNFDFSVVPMLSKARVSALAAGDIWLDKATNLLLMVSRRPTRATEAPGLLAPPSLPMSTSKREALKGCGDVLLAPSHPRAGPRTASMTLPGTSGAAAARAGSSRSSPNSGAPPDEWRQFPNSPSSRTPKSGATVQASREATRNPPAGSKLRAAARHGEAAMCRVPLLLQIPSKQFEVGVN